MSDSVEPKGAEKIGEKIGFIQPHGGMLTPGNPGNKGGTGRPPNAIRKLYKELLEGHAEVVATDILTGDNPRNKVAMMDHLAKYSLGEVKQVMEEELMTAVMDVAYKMLEPKQATAFVQAVTERLTESA